MQNNFDSLENARRRGFFAAMLNNLPTGPKAKSPFLDPVILQAVIEFNKHKRLKLYWNKHQSNIWETLWGVNLEHSHFDGRAGVYIIWYWSKSYQPITVRLGQGFIKERFKDHKKDSEILKCARGYILYATWADVPIIHRDGVEKYLADILKPLVGDQYPNAIPIEVNLPWY